MRLTLSINVLRIGCMGNNAMILTEETKKDYTGIGIITEEKKDGERKYIGDYVDGKEHGTGTYTSKNGRHKYTGEFNEDIAEGIGIKLYQHGGKYCGNFKNNKRNGLGYWKLPTGAVFIGNYKNHYPKGFGMMITWEGLKFIGHVNSSWNADVCSNGILQGTWYDQEDNEIDITKLGYEYNGNKYEGEWKDGKKHGQGTYTWSNGDVYEGEWKDNNPNGQGTLTFPDGTTYEGEFKENKPLNITEYDKYGNITGRYVNGVEQ